MEILKGLAPSLVLGALAIIALTAIIIPVALRLAGLTGQQIVDVLSLTATTFLQAIKEFRNQNAPK